MLDIYQPMDDNARSARLKRQRLQQDLEDLQKTMFTDLDRLEKGVSGGLRYKDHISSYQQTLNVSSGFKGIRKSNEKDKLLI